VPNRSSNPLLIVLLLALIAVGTAHAEDASVPFPHPDLSELQPRVRDVLQPAITYFERSRGRMDGAELASLYGGLGMHYQAQRMNEPAELAYRRALALAPDDFRWNYYLGFLLEESDRLDEAQLAYRRALAVEPGYLPARMRLGHAAIAAGDVAGAERAFRSVLADAPEDASALAGLGQVLAARGEHAEAITMYRRALEHQPGADQLHYLLALSYQATGDNDTARTEMALRGERTPFTPDPTLALMTIRTQGSTPFVRRAVSELQAGRTEQGLNALEIAIAINPLDLDARITLARALVLRGDPTRAEEMLRIILQLDPMNALAMVNLGDLLLRTDRPADAAEVLGRAVQIEARPTTYAQLASALSRSGRYADAAVIYVQLGEVERPEGSEAPDPYYFAGIAFEGAGQCKLAIDALSLAYQRNAPNPARMDALIRVVSTCPDATGQQRSDAMHMAANLYNNLPSQWTSETYAMALAANQRFDDAVDLQGQAIFEALRDGNLAANPQLQENMQRYNAQQRATIAWPAGHEIYSLSLASASQQAAAAAEAAAQDGAQP